jgi:hypothetical protein
MELRDADLRRLKQKQQQEKKEPISLERPEVRPEIPFYIACPTEREA